ncbi:MAG: DUF4468 domain-containing protein [Bacteroidales bacterium]|nr:DUF4468 domain-containing protein [Bacteroidales bacterium]
MKTIYILFCLMVASNAAGLAQPPRFDLKKDGIQPVVIEFGENFPDSVIYLKVKEWIALNNKSPKSVTRVDNENELVKFSCFSKDGWKGKVNNYDYWYELAYTLTVEIKDYKCRVTFNSDESRYNFWYNDNGSIKENFKESEKTFESTVNNTLVSLYNHIAGIVKKESDNW